MQELKDKVFDFGLENLKNEVSKKFINMDDVVETIFISLCLGKNCILFGKGGYGKSSLVKYISKILDIPLYTKNFNSGTTIENILGIPDMDLLKKKSILKYAWHNTIFSKDGIAVFEEMLDARGDVLSCLKDIITEGGLRDIDTFNKSNITSFIACTNKDPKQFIDSFDDVDKESIKSFIDERFPYQIEVKWDSYETNDYYNLLKLNSQLKDDDNYLLSSILSSSFNEKISPRKAVYISEQINKFGFDSLKVFNISNLDINEHKKKSEKAKLINNQNDLLKNIKEDIYKLTNIKQPEKLIECCIMFKKLNIISSLFLKSGPFSDEVVSSELYKNISDEINHYSKYFLNRILELTKI